MPHPTGLGGPYEAHVAIRVNLQTGLVDQAAILSEFPPTEMRGCRWFRRAEHHGQSFREARERAVAAIERDPELFVLFGRFCHEQPFDRAAPRRGMVVHGFRGR